MNGVESVQTISPWIHAVTKETYMSILLKVN